MTDLEKLIEAVKADAVPFGGWSILSSATHVFASEWARQAHSGSLDAARALHEALLPGWKWDGYDEYGWAVWQKGAPDTPFIGEAPTPARSWLLAILRAYAARDAA